MHAAQKCRHAAKQRSTRGSSPRSRIRKKEESNRWETGQSKNGLQQR